MDVASSILALPGWAVLLVVFLLPGLESSVFLGFVFPGEISLLLGGVLAHEGRVSVYAVIAVGIAGAIGGDAVGYLVGRRYGRRVLDSTLGRFVKQHRLDTAQEYLARRGGPAVFLGRFTATLRVLIPGLAGMSRMRYSVFAVYNVMGAVGWVVLSVLLGYLAGASWQHAQKIASGVGLVVFGVLVLLLLLGLWLRKIRERARPDPPSRLL